MASSWLETFCGLRRHFPAVPIKVILIDVDCAQPLTKTEIEVMSDEEVRESSESTDVETV